jgi:hypothetical protein
MLPRLMSSQVDFRTSATLSNRREQRSRRFGTSSPGRAEIQILAAFGAFTIRISIVDENIKLELDLSELDSFPIWFRENYYL